MQPYPGPSRVPAGPPPRGHSPYLLPLIALSGVAVVLVAAIVAVTVGRTDHGQPGAGAATGRGPTASPAGRTGPAVVAGQPVDPCLVGTWRTIVDSQQRTVGGLGPVVVTGQGLVVHIGPDGTEVRDFSAATPYEGTADEKEVRVTVTGSIRATIRTDGHTMSFHGVSADGTVAASIDGTQLSAVPLTAGPDPVSYTCSGGTATERTEGYDVTLTRTSASP